MHKKLSKWVVLDLIFISQLLERLTVPVLLVFCSFLFGMIGFLLIGQGRWSALDCAYMTSITLTTVGYGEVLSDLGTDGKIFAMVLMWSGMGVTLYAVSTITAFVVEKDLMRMFRERKMERQINILQNHIIVCGVGKTGLNIVNELFVSKCPCVVIEEKEERLQTACRRLRDLHYIQGDATEEMVLRQAGIERARGIIAGLNDDGRNLLITVQARYINPEIKIVARCHENSLADKMIRAGANYVVNPGFIGGMRLASEMIRPHVVSFLDRMLRGKDQSIRLEEVVVGRNNTLTGLTLNEIDLYRRTGLNPVAIKHPQGDDYTYNPSPDERIEHGTVMIVIGNPDQVGKIRNVLK